MAYEERIIIVNVRRTEYPNGKPFIDAEEIASYNCSRMPESFNRIFTEGCDFTVQDYFSEDEGTRETAEDRYGDPIKSAPIQLVTEKLREYLSLNDYYRRYRPLLGLLEGFNPADWEELRIVHFGY